MPRNFLGGFLILSHQPAKLGVHRSCEGGDLTSFIRHVTTISKCHATSSGSILLLSHHPAKFGVHRPCGFFSRDHLLDVSHEFVGRVPSS